MTEEDRLLGLAAPALLPILEKRRARALDELQAAHRMGKTDFSQEVTRYVVITEIVRDVETKLKQYEGEKNAR